MKRQLDTLEMEKKQQSKSSPSPLLPPFFYHKDRLKKLFPECHIDFLDPLSLDEVWVHGNCPDGKGAQTVAYLYQRIYGKSRAPFTFRFLYHSQGLPDASSDQWRNKNIAIFDFCPKAEEIKDLRERAKSVMIFDHHESAKPLVDANADIAYYTPTFSGVALAWRYFFSHIADEMPLWVRWIQDRDLWQHKVHGSNFFYEFMGYWRDLQKSTLTTSPVAQFPIISFLWPESNDTNYQFPVYSDSTTLECPADKTKEICTVGSILITKKEMALKAKANWVKKTYFLGMLVVTQNTAEDQSDLSNAILSTHQDVKMVLLWSFDHSEILWRVSVRSRDNEVDSSKVCAIFGGGGHFAASGFKLSWQEHEMISFFINHTYKVARFGPYEGAVMHGDGRYQEACGTYILSQRPNFSFVLFVRENKLSPGTCNVQLVCRSPEEKVLMDKDILHIMIASNAALMQDISLAYDRVRSVINKYIVS